MIWLKFVCPILVLCIVWWWNRRKRVEKKQDDGKPYFEFGTSELEVLVKEFPLLEGLESMSYRFYKVMEGKEIVGIILYNWPSSLWSFRQKREEEIELGSYSHIHYIQVLEGSRGKGYLTQLLDHVFSETHRISSGITIDVVDPVLRDVLMKKFEFKDYGTYLRIDYDNWSRF